MEQYELAKSKYFSDLCYCIQNYKPESILIRPVGSASDIIKTKISENLQDKKLNVRKTTEGLLFSINESEIFLFQQNKNWGHKFSVSYERYPDKNGVIPMLSTGINPDDSSLPEVRISSFRCANLDYMLYLNFQGKIPLKFHSWYDKSCGWKYWCVKR
jgi:hypothetical protein